MDSQALVQDDLAETEPTALGIREAQIQSWRLEQLERAGYSDGYAASLAEDHRVDLHQACDLLAGGCPERTAFLILS
ncbi:MAG: hypothetical protein QOE36_3250 [Gaiellaceae bacterium]|nr:hypothetical protein [Gaiellaceae bacterium]